MRHAVVVVMQLLWFGAVAGCGSPPDAGPPREVKDFPVTVNPNLDLLFVIDDSPSMRDKQLNLAANFPRFIEVLSSIPGGLPSVHIGVATPDMGTQAAGDPVPGPAIGMIGQGGCADVGDNGVLQPSGVSLGTSGTDKFIRDIVDPVTGTRQTNYTGNLADVIAEMATGVGAGGCGFEQHLAAVRRSLENPENTGFLRPNAVLGVIVIADEDDCSLEHHSLLGPTSPELGTRQSFRCTRFGVLCDRGGQTPDEMNQPGTKSQCHPSDSSAYLTQVNQYVSFLQGLKTDPRNVVVAGILGATASFAVERRQIGGQDDVALAHSCTYPGGDLDGDGTPDSEVADPPIRLKSFLDQFPNRSSFTTVCQQDLSGGLSQIAELLKTSFGVACIQGTLADIDPNTPGPQYDCDVTVADPAQPAQGATELPRCTPEDATPTNPPCWHLAVDPTSCPSRDHLRIAIEGSGSLPSTAHVIASCAI